MARPQVGCAEFCARILDAIKTRGLAVIILRRPEGGEPAGFRELYACHDLGEIILSDGTVGSLWHAVAIPELWQEFEYRTATFSLSPHQRNESSLIDLWMKFGRHIWAIGSPDKSKIATAQSPTLH